MFFIKFFKGIHYLLTFCLYSLHRCVNSHLYQLMTAVVSSRCSHTRDEDGIPIGVDGIRFITGTAENNLKAEV